MSKKTESQGQSDEKLARKWKCSARTIRTWKAARAPFDDPKRMRVWLSNKRHVPAGTAAQLALSRRKQAAKVVVHSDPQEVGSLRALIRLESAEAQGYSAFQQALSTGDPISIKSTRESWLRISGELRKFDLQLQESRRKFSDLVPRADAVDAAGRFCCLFEHGIRGGFQKYAPLLIGLKNPQDLWEAAQKLMRDCVESTLGVMRSENDPEWLVDAVADSMSIRDSWLGLKPMTVWFEYWHQVLTCLFQPLQSNDDCREKFFTAIAEAFEAAGLTPQELPPELRSSKTSDDTIPGVPRESLDRIKSPSE